MGSCCARLAALLAVSCDAPSSDEAPGWDAVPTTAYCDEAREWQPQWTDAEEQLLELVNARRAQGADCGTAGNFAASDPMTMNPKLRCAARLHVADMAARDFFDHTNPSGESAFERIAQAGYAFSTAGENIAGGSADAGETVAQWMASDGHCSNIMNPGFVHLGAGYHPGGEHGHLWTQSFAAP